MKIAIYAFDRGPYSMFSFVAEAARKRGHEVIQMSAAQLMPTEEFMTRAHSANIVLVNFSALQKNAEVQFLEQLGEVPFVVVDDLFGAPFRPYAKEWAPRAAGVILALDFQQKRAEDFGYRKHCIFHVGPPAHWQEGYLRLRDCGDQRMNMGLTQGGFFLPVSPKDFIVFYAGSKYPEENNNIIEGVITAGRAEAGERLALSWRPRPRLDEEPPQLPAEASEEQKRKRKTEVAALEPLFRRREELFQSLPLVDFGKASMQECMKSADVSILTGGSTDSLLASYARVPFVYWHDEQNVHHLQTTGASDGQWFVAERGGGRVVGNTEELRKAFQEFRTPEGLTALREAQERAFPLPKTWDTAPLVVELAEDIV